MGDADRGATAVFAGGLRPTLTPTGTRASIIHDEISRSLKGVVAREGIPQYLEALAAASSPRARARAEKTGAGGARLPTRPSSVELTPGGIARADGPHRAAAAAPQAPGIWPPASAGRLSGTPDDRLGRRAARGAAQALPHGPARAGRSSSGCTGCVIVAGRFRPEPGPARVEPLERRWPPAPRFARTPRSAATCARRAGATSRATRRCPSASFQPDHRPPAPARGRA